MNYILQSIKTRSYWKYALWTTDSLQAFLAILGGFWLIFESASFFKWVNQDTLPSYTLLILMFFSVIGVIVTRRPLTKIKYRLAGKDLTIEVKIGDLFDEKGQRVISTNTTFDTDIQGGIIAAGSLQGQFTTKYFPQNISALDTALNAGLVGIPSSNYSKVAGKNKKYPMGATVRINIAGDVFYWLAMSDLNYDNTATTTLQNVLNSVDDLWSYIAQKGENTPIVLPLIGTGKGRIPTHRKQVIARLAQSFTRASENQVFSSKLIIVVHPADAENFSINLFEVRDLLNHYLP
jgi:hypothetical protein